MNKAAIFAFSLGVAVGSVVTWRVLKEKYEKLTREEIASYKTVIGKQFAPYGYATTDEGIEKVEAETPEQIIDKCGYDTQSEEKEVVEDLNTIHVIAPEEYGEADDYDLVSLTYYADGVLTDDWKEPIEDVAKIVGEDFHTHFGEYGEPDSVFIRNDRLKTDYEILLSQRNFSDVLKGEIKITEENGDVE